MAAERGSYSSVFGILVQRSFAREKAMNEGVGQRARERV